MKRFLLAAWLSLTCTFASATGFSTDATDLWYNPNESGWGVNIIQQDDTLFATLFVYDNTNTPFWYVGSNIRYSSTNSSGHLIYTGDWFRTTGPYFGGTFNPAAVNAVKVGTATFTLTTVSTATFVYTVDAITVTKNVQRQTWRNEILTGSYRGGTVGTSTGCGTAVDGYGESYATFVVSHTGSSVRVVETGTGGVGYTCTYDGTYAQTGRLGSVTGTFSCNFNSSGTFAMTEMDLQFNGLIARLRTQDGNCVFNGRIGGVARD